MKIKKLGIPYMGSKRTIASKIVDYILLYNPKCKYVYDLFGGGGAISFEFIQRKQIKQVVYNELDAGIVSLLKDIIENDVTEKYYQWIDRETFYVHKNDEDWFGGLLKTCWSFGNNVEKGYLFSVENELMKKPLHLAIVNQETNYLDEFEKIAGMKIPYDLLNDSDLHTRRLKVMGWIKKNKRIELQKLQQLEQLEQLTILNDSYENVKINTPVEETIIYLDPPYINTAKYQKDLCHNRLYEYIENSPYKIYLSSYESYLPCVLEIEKRSILSATVNNKVIEKLFCNREEYDIKPRLF